MPMEPHPTIASQPVGCGLLDQLNEQNSMLKKHGKKSGKSTTYDSWVIPTIYSYYLVYSTLLFYHRYYVHLPCAHLFGTGLLYMKKKEGCTQEALSGNIFIHVLASTFHDWWCRGALTQYHGVAWPGE